MFRKTVSLVTAGIFGFSTMAFADSFYTENINNSFVDSTALTTSVTSVLNTPISTTAAGATLSINTIGDGDIFESTNLNEIGGDVSALSTTSAATVNLTSIDTLAVGAQLGVTSVGNGNSFLVNDNTNEVAVGATANTTVTGLLDSPISTTAAGAVLSIDNTGNGNLFSSFNLNTGNVTALSNTTADTIDLGSSINTLAVGAQLGIVNEGNNNNPFFSSNINNGVVDSTAFITTFDLFESSISTTAAGAVLSIDNTGNGNDLKSLNKNTANVTALSDTFADFIDFSSSINTLAVGAQLGIGNVGNGNMFFNDTFTNNLNTGNVTATSATNTLEFFDSSISTTAAGAVLSIDNAGNNNVFDSINENTANVTALSNTFVDSIDSIDDPINLRTSINTLAVGAQTGVVNVGKGNSYPFIDNINSGTVLAQTDTQLADLSLDVNLADISTTAVGSSLSINNSYTGSSIVNPNTFDSYNLNLGNVTAITNTVANSISGSTLSTTAIGAAVSISNNIPTP